MQRSWAIPSVRRHISSALQLLCDKMRLGSEDLKLWAGYRQLCRRVNANNSSCGVGHARGRTDRCPHCKAWDTTWSKQYRQTTDWVQDGLKGLSKMYWQHFDYEPPVVAFSSRTEDPKYYAAMLEYIQSDKPERGEENDKNIHKLEEKAAHRLEPICWCVLQMSLHWQLRDRSWENLRNLQQHPDPRCAYLHSDWKDPQ